MSIIRVLCDVETQPQAFGETALSHFTLLLGITKIGENKSCYKILGYQLSDPLIKCNRTIVAARLLELHVTFTDCLSKHSAIISEIYNKAFTDYCDGHEGLGTYKAKSLVRLLATLLRNPWISF